MTISDILLTDLSLDIKECELCPLHTTRKNAVPGVGLSNSPAVLIAEKPGYQEDRTGYPMAGESGKVFDRILSEVGLSRRDFFITNTIKCKPPKDPTLQQIDTCKVWMDRQLEIIRPKVLVLCGRYAIASYFPGEKVGDIHGRPRRTWERIVIPTYHPATLIHNERLWEFILSDFRVVKELLHT